MKLAPPPAPWSPGPGRARGMARADSGFSLIELLVVMFVIGILAYLIVGSIKGISNSTDMTRASEDLSAVVNLASQRAAAFNRQTSILFLRTSSTGSFVAYQLWEQTNSQDPSSPWNQTTPSSSTSWQPVLPIQRLPADVVITSNSSFSTFLTRSSTSTITGTWIDHTGTSWNYAQIYFAPDGSLVASTGQTSITLQAANGPANVSGLVSGLPPNFAVVDIQPLHSIPIIYRPQ